MKNPFLFAAGVDSNTLNRCSSSEQNKYKILGSMIYVPLVTGMVSIIFGCLYYTTNVLVIAAACLLWGGVVFCIERALISSLRPKTFNFAVCFRVVAAVAMSAIISELLIMFLFQDQISEYGNVKSDKEVEAIHEKYRDRIESLQEELKEYNDEIAKQESALIEEIQGVSGSMKRGDGKVAAEKRKALERKTALYETEKRRIETEIADLKAEDALAKKSIDLRRKSGLMESVIGLHEMARTNRTVFWVLVIMHVFFLTIELMPLVIKLSYRGSQYYDIQDVIENQHLDVARQTSANEMQVLLLQRQSSLHDDECSLQTATIQKDVNANYKQYVSISETLLKAAKKATELETDAKEAEVDGDKLTSLKTQLNILYDAMLKSVAGRAVAE